ncbi:hypothetical protein CsatB_006719 [Cannabis sativa]
MAGSQEIQLRQTFAEPFRHKPTKSFLLQYQKPTKSFLLLQSLTLKFPQEDGERSWIKFVIKLSSERPLKDREALLESHKDGYRIESHQRRDGLVAKSRLMTADDRGMGGYDDEMGYDPNPKPKMHMKGGKIGEDCEAISKNKQHQDRVAALEVWDRLEEFVRSRSHS